MQGLSFLRCRFLFHLDILLAGWNKDCYIAFLQYGGFVLIGRAESPCVPSNL